MQLDPRLALPIGVVLLRSGEEDGDDMLLTLYEQDGRFLVLPSDDSGHYEPYEPGQDDLEAFRGHHPPGRGHCSRSEPS